MRNNGMMPFNAVFFLAVTLCVSIEAHAFTRTLDMATHGICLWWAERKVNIHINDQCSNDIPAEDRDNCFDAVRKSFAAWSDVECSDFRFVDKGLTDSVEVGFDTLSPEKNTNLIIWQETDWEHDPNAIALTTTTYDSNSGLIVDTDIEMNGVSWNFAYDGNPYDFDIQNTITHEAGHNLGLDHSPYIDATMNEVAVTGEIIKRDLHEDDINGVCFIYPSEDLTPPYFLDDNHRLISCGNDGLEGYPSGCGCGGDERFSVEILMVIGLLWLWLRRHRRCFRRIPEK